MLILTSITFDGVVVSSTPKYSCDDSFLRGLIYRPDAIADEAFFETCLDTIRGESDHARTRL